MNSSPTSHFRLFGSPSLERDGSSLPGRATQRHRLALLALLALSPDRRASRDRLIATLWPERDEDRGRNLLKVATYVLREALGESAVLSEGDYLRLNADVVQTDVVEFVAAVERSDHAAAVVLYRGPLLDGFFLSDAPEFEHWADRERHRLRSLYGGALEALANAAERDRDFRRSTEWWKARSAVDLYDSRVALRLMQALEASGNPAGALQHAAIHQRLLEQELGVSSVPEIEALVDRLRRDVRVDANGDVHDRSGAAPAASPDPVESTADREPEPPDLDRAGDAVSPPMAPLPPPVRGPPPPVGTRGRSGMWRWLAVAALVVVAALGAVWAVAFSRHADPEPSIAVLPFVNLSADGDNEYFSDGLTEEVISRLAGVPGLKVISRTSAMHYKGTRKPLREIAGELRVAHILEGSVRQGDKRVRISAQLIDAATGYHIWSRDYDREVADVLAVQDEIAQAIAGALELRLPARAAAPRARRAPDPVAYDLYLRARHLRDDLSADALQAAARLLDRAIELEPDFALAYATKAAIVAPGIYYGHVPREQGVSEMRVAIARALELDPQLGEAHVALGILELFFDWDWDDAERALRRAVELNPSDPHAWHHLGNQLAAVGRLEEAVDARARSIALDPLNARVRIVLAMDLMAAGRFDEALAQYERVRRLDAMIPQALGHGPMLPVGGRILMLGGREEDAVDELVRVAALRGATAGELDALRRAFAEDGMRGFWRGWLDMDLRLSGGAIDPMRLAVLWAHIGDADQSLDWLERAHAERNPGIIVLRTEPAFADLRTHPRFVRIVREMKLPDR